MTMRFKRLALLSAGTLAAALWPLAAPGQTPATFRSVDDVRPRIPDEMDRPFRRETSSHRGWEIREDQFAIAANTSLEDARWAARQVMQVRGQLGQVLDRFTEVHHQPDFGLNSLQIVIDQEPHRDRYGAMTTIDVVGIQTNATINVAPGQPPLADQVLRLREAGAFAMLHAAGMDAMLPPWVVSGLASHAALTGQPQPAPKGGEIARRGVAMGGQQWRWQRSTQDKLEEHPLGQDQASSMVSFLLEGNDAEHAPQLLALVKHAVADKAAQAAEGKGIQQRRGEVALPPTNTPFDALAQAYQAQYEAWLSDPQIGRPVFTPPTDAEPELIREQEQMLVVLKLQRRVKTTGETRSGVKIVTFDKAQRTGVSASPTVSRPADVGDLLRRIGDLRQLPLATVDADGSLLLTSDRGRMQQLLGFDGRRYRTEQRGERAVTVVDLPGDKTLHGWLEENPENPSRPLAKFAVVQRTFSR